MNATDPSGVISFAAALKRIPSPTGEPAALVLGRGTLDVKLLLGELPNPQVPRTQDEIYVVARGSGVLVHGGRRDAFVAGDLLFVAAGVGHFYERVSADLALWRMFYGPQGGEVPE